MPVIPAGRPLRVRPAAPLRGRGVSGTGSVRPRPRTGRTRRRERLRQRVERCQIRNLRQAGRQSAPSPLAPFREQTQCPRKSRAPEACLQTSAKFINCSSALRYRSISRGGSYAIFFRADRRVRTQIAFVTIARASENPIVDRSRDPPACEADHVFCTVRPPAAWAGAEAMQKLSAP